MAIMSTLDLYGRGIHTDAEFCPMKKGYRGEGA